MISLLTSKNTQTRSLINLKNSTGLLAYKIFDEEMPQSASYPTQNFSKKSIIASLVKEINQLKMNLALCKKDVEFFKA